MVIDLHTHVGSLGIRGGTRDEPDELSVNYADRIRIMDQNGIDEAVIMPPNNYIRADGIEATRRLNDSIRAIVERHDRIVAGLVTVEPPHGEAALDEIDRIADGNTAGIVWHHRFQGGAIDEPSAKRCIEHAGTYELPIFIHCFPYSNLESLQRVNQIAHLTDSPIVLLDAFGDPDNVDIAIDLGDRFDHLYFDTALLFSLGRIVERLVEALGSDRLLFGSDFYADPIMYEFSSDLFQIRKAAISDEARQDILERNTRRILDL